MISQVDGDAGSAPPVMAPVGWTAAGKAVTSALMGREFFRDADWLDARRTRGYFWIAAVVNTGALAFLLLTSHHGIDRNGFLLGTDFLSFWTTGRMLQSTADVYDVAAHTLAQRSYFAQDGLYTAFFYPPVFLPFCWPLGLLDYFPALALWLLTTSAAFLFAAGCWLKGAGLKQPLFLLFAAFPPVVITWTHGQTALLVAALLGLGTLLVRDRPWIGGLLLGLATIKPQFGLLVPIALVLTGEWRAIVGAVLGAVMLAMLATVAFGPGVWPDWFDVAAAAQSAMDQGSVGYAKMQSLLAAALLLGAPAWLAYALQGLLTLLVAGAVAWASWGRRFDMPLAALILAGAPLATPFVLDYDLVLLAFPLIWLASGGFLPWEKLVLVLTFALGAFARPLGLEAGVPIAPMILIGFFVAVLRRTRRESPPVAEGQATPGGCA